jgi:hypothetical protein
MQANSYLGLWGHVFEAPGSKNKNEAVVTGPASPIVAGLADRLHQAAGEWRTEADEVRSRLIQRLGGGNTILGKAAAAAGEEREAASAFMSETFNQLFGGNINKDMPVEGNAAATAENSNAASISTTDTLSLLDRMQARLGLDGKVDARQLAALAAIQGLALSSLRKHLAAAQSENHLDTPASGVVKTLSAATTEANDGTNYLYDPLRHSFSKLGVALPESMVSHFEGEWCLRLQNFANAAGYRSVYLGGVPCSGSGTAVMTKASPLVLPSSPPSLASAVASSPPATAMLQWNSEAAFSLDCSVNSPQIEDNGDQNSEEDSLYTGVSAMWHAASSELSAALQAKTMQCSLAVSSVAGNEVTPSSSSSSSQTQSAGSGAVLHSSQNVPAFNPHKLHAIKLRVCNLPVQSAAGGGTATTGTASSSTSTTTSSGAGSINVHGLKVNNRHLAVDSIQGHSSNECHVALVRLPTRALADGFVFNGYVTLEKGGSTAGGVYNVGEMASVEMQIGSLRLLSSSPVSGVEGAAVEVDGVVLPSPLPPPPPQP